MKPIDEWEKLFSDAVEKRWPGQTQEQIIDFIQQELNDIKGAFLVEQGKEKSTDHRFDHVNERIAGLIANVFVLTKKRDENLDKILQQALDWYLDLNTIPSSLKK